MAATRRQPPSHEESAIATLARSRATPRSVRQTLQSRIASPLAAPGALVLALLLLWLLVGPRIDLPALHGLRVEDLVFAGMAAVCLVHARGFGRPSGPTLGVIAVVATGLLSAVIASARGMVDPVQATLFAVRPLEYWVAFPSALLLLHSQGGRWLRRVDALLVIVTLLQTAFAVLQYYFGLHIGFSHAAYSRAAGLTVGPYELGAMSAALVVYWVAHGRWTMASLSTVALAASISRVSILGAGVAVVVLVLAWAVQVLRRVRATGWVEALGLRGRSRLVSSGQVLSVAAAALVLAFTVGLIRLPAASTSPEASGPQPAPAAGPTGSSAEPTPADSTPATQGTTVGPQAPAESIAGRLASTSVLGSWNAAADIAAMVPRPRDAVEYQFAAYAGMNIYLNVNTAADAGAEASNLVRFFRWHLILDTMDDPADVVFGLGPSFVGPSVDGSYLRFFADGGVIGVLAWLLLIVMLLRRTPLWMVCVTISFLIGAVFIDIVYAERPMVLYWVLLAVALARRGTAGPSSPVTRGRVSSGRHRHVPPTRRAT